MIFLKKKSNSRNQYQHQTILKFHNLNSRIQKYLIYDSKIVNLQCKIVVLNFIQLHIHFVNFEFSIILALINLDAEKSDFENFEFQLNQEIFNFNDDSIDVSIQML